MYKKVLLKPRSRFYQWKFFLVLLFLASPSVEGAKNIPPPPQNYVLDEVHVVSGATEQVLRSLLSEHDRLTGEQIVIAVFETLDGEDLVDFTNKVFTQWKIGLKGKNNGILLALYWKNRKARIEVGYGLEPLLTDAKSKLILSETLIPFLKAGQPNEALVSAATEILKVIESPLIQTGKVARDGHHFRRQGVNAQFWVVWVALGAFLLMFIVSIFFSGDALFTRRGWHSPSGWSGVSFGNWGSSGGSGRGWGGFSGGGGSSGGGGASGSW